VDPASKLMSKVAGVVLLPAGIALVALCAWILQRQFTLKGGVTPSAFIFSAVVGIVGFFCTLIGYRLALDRPNRYQSLLPPIGWYILALVFAVIGFVLGVVVLRRADYTQLIGVACCFVFASWCWRAGRIAHARGRSDAHAF
jgi:hypothetical protein